MNTMKPKPKLTMKSTDKQMLDLCQRHMQRAFKPCGNSGWRIYTGEITGAPDGEGPTLRAAIRAAMEGGGR